MEHKLQRSKGESHSASLISAVIIKLHSNNSTLRTMTNDPLWLSLGEACLPDDILKRHGLKSFSTPYSSARSNIDYAIQLEGQQYRDLLMPDHLVYGDAWGTRVVRSISINQSEAIFEDGCRKGFEFTHHNPIESLKDRQSYQRKIDRLNTIRGKKDAIFLYHHRLNKSTSIEKIIDKLECFAGIYTSSTAKCSVILIHQIPIQKKMARRVLEGYKSDSVFEFIFHTEAVWAGNDPNVFWGRNDDDLFDFMFKKVKRDLNISS